VPLLLTCARRALIAVTLATLLLGGAGAAPAAPAAPAISAKPGITPTFNGAVYAVAHRGPYVYVGGAFTSATWGGRSYRRLRLAAFDARTGALLPWTPAADGLVRALAATDESVYAAGDFHAVSGERRDSLARLHPTSGTVASFRHTLSGTPYALAIGNGRLYLGGDFTDVDGSPRGNLAAFDLTGGRLDTGWRPVADDTVRAIETGGARVYAGGGFHNVNKVTGTLRLAALNGSTGAPDPAFVPRPPAEVHAIAADGNGPTVAAGGVGGRAIAYSRAGVQRWQRVFDGDAATLAIAGGVTYVGGHFDSACLTGNTGAHGACVDGSQPRVKLAAVTATGDLAPWAPQANGIIGVRVLSVNRATGALEAGGDFTTIGGRDRRRFAAF
jgi:beta-propeller uncharacterized protein DUF5122